MSLAVLLGGTIAPFLLMLSPLSVAAARDCLDWEPPAKAVGTAAKNPCPRPPLLLM